MIPAVRALAIAIVVFSAAACSSDLFHATDWQTRCDKDPKLNGCPASGADATSSSSATTGGGGAGGSGGQGGQGGTLAACVGIADCTACHECARVELCADEAATCEATTDCIPLMDCAYACGNDTACIQACAGTYPGGINEASALAQCEACGTCADACKDLCGLLP